MKTLTLVIALACALLVAACDDDPTRPPTSGGGIKNENLTQRWHVLNNIEYAYKTRRIDIYDELLNSDFVFFFSPGDVNGGAPETFNRAEEKDATGRLFASNQQSEPPADPVCRTIRLDLIFEADDLQWVEVQPEAFPGETWYSTTVFYTFTFEMEPNTTYIAQNGAKAQFTVRNTGTDQDPHWELVEFRDLGS